MLIHGYRVTIGKYGHKEIDFICEKGNERIYIQVTLSLANEKVKNSEYGNLLDLQDNSILKWLSQPTSTESILIRG